MWRKWREHYRVTPLVGLMKVVEDLLQVHFLYLGSCRLRVYPTDLQELPHQALQALHVPDHQLHRPAEGGVQRGFLSAKGRLIVARRREGRRTTMRRHVADRTPHWT